MPIHDAPLVLLWTCMYISSNAPEMNPSFTPSFLNMKENLSSPNTKLGHLRHLAH
jgi:hypothetical protein